VGRGASSLNAAAILAEENARVKLLTRRHKIHIHVVSRERRSLWQRLRHPASPLGAGMRSWLACTFPGAVQVLPAWFRRALVYKHLGPSGGSALRGRIEGRVERLLGWSIQSAAVVDRGGEQRVHLQLVSDAGERRELEVSHVIAGTGYRVDMRRLQFLSASLRDSVRLLRGGGPRLNGRFESSVPHLYFVGPSASPSFGPLQRFAAGADFAATRLTRALQREYLHSTQRHAAGVSVAHTAGAEPR
jgi:hypothetical protein